jgi:N-acetylglucosamine malate deacetylase 1
MLRGLLNRLERQLWARRSHKFVIRNWSVLPSLNILADILATMRAASEIAPLVLDVPVGKRILVVAPHPDDEIIGPGGTLIGAINGGAKVHVVYLTSGSNQPELAQLREEEARTAAQLVNYSTEFLNLEGLRDGAHDAAVAALAGAIAAYRPEILFTPFFADDHIEHRRASELLLKVFRQGLVQGDLEIWAYQVYSCLIANVAIDITSFNDAKSDAIRIFASQFKSRDWAHFATGLSAYNSRLLPGNGACHAELFHVSELRDYAELCGNYFASEGGNLMDGG